MQKKTQKKRSVTIGTSKKDPSASSCSCNCTDSTSGNNAVGWTERNLIYRPERLSYIRRSVKKFTDCVFCRAVNDGCSPDSLLIYKGNLSIAILNKFPYNNGHVLVLPLRHCGNIEELSREEVIEISLLKHHVITTLSKIYKCDGLNVGANLGSVAGAGIPEHMHYHIVPRWFGDTNFFPLIANTKVIVESLEISYNRLRPYFENLTL